MAKQTQDRGTGDLQAVTANRLTDGLVVWLTSAHGWTVDIALAGAFDAAALPAALEAGQASERRREVVDVYATEVRLEDGRPRPARLRERIRAEGPSTPYGAPALSPAAPAFRTVTPAFGSFHAGE